MPTARMWQGVAQLMGGINYNLAKGLMPMDYSAC